MLKKEYMAFASQVSKFLKDRGATQDEYGRYHLDTNYGKLRVSIEEFRPRMRVCWLFTRIDSPESVPCNIASSPDFDRFNGKYNTYGSDSGYLFFWLKSYVNTLLKNSYWEE